MILDDLEYSNRIGPLLATGSGLTQAGVTVLPRSPDGDRELLGSHGHCLSRARASVEESLYRELDRLRKTRAGVLSEIAAKRALRAPVQSAYARTARSSARGGYKEPSVIATLTV